MTNVTRRVSDWACGVQFEDLPPEVVHEAKRFLMDSVGCALGGAQQHDVHIAREVLTETAGSGNCRVMVTGERTYSHSLPIGTMCDVLVRDSVSAKVLPLIPVEAVMTDGGWQWVGLRELQVLRDVQ